MRIGDTYIREKERERERTQQVRSGSARRKNDAASSRRVQNSAGIPGVSSPMGNNEDSASFITTCSSIPDLTSRAPTSGIHPGSSPSLLSATPFLARARERDVSEAPGVCLALNHPVATRVPTPHPLRPLIFSRFRPTLAAYPGNALGSVIANRGTGLDIVRKVYRVRVYIYECARPRV